MVFGAIGAALPWQGGPLYSAGVIAGFSELWAAQGKGIAAGLGMPPCVG